MDEGLIAGFARLRAFLLRDAPTCFATAGDILFARNGFGVAIASVAQNGWIATALAETCPRDPEVAAALQTCAAHVAREARPEGWTYYSRCPDIPPDTDDLALAMSLLHAAEWPSRARLLDGPLRLLRFNTSAPGYFRTWLCHEGEPSEIDDLWASRAAPVQPDVVANIAWALLSGGHVEWETDIRAAIRWLSDDPLARLGENHWYYGDGYVGFLMMRLFADCPASWREHRRASDAADALAVHLLKGQSPDGSWPLGGAPVARRTLARADIGEAAQGCLETGWRVAALRESRHGDCAGAVGAARQFLLQRQMADGGYPSEPFYETVSPEPYGSRAVTAAAVLRALSPVTRPGMKAPWPG